MNNHEVIVVGCGGRGSAALYWLSRELRESVLGLERFETLQAYYTIAGRDLERELVPLIESEKLGRLKFNVRDELKRTWGRDTRLDRQNKKLEGLTPQLTGKYAKPQ